MRLTILFFVGLILPNFPGQAQQKTKDIDRYTQLYSRAISQYRVNQDSSLVFARASADIAKKINDYDRFCSSVNIVGLIEKSRGQYLQAVETFQTCLLYETDVFDSSILAKVYNNIGNTHNRLDNRDSSFLYLTKATWIYEKMEDEPMLSKNYISLGNFYSFKKEFINALEYYSKSLNIEEKLNSPAGISIANTNIGNVFFERQQYDSALFFYKKSEGSLELIANKSPLQKRSLANILHNMANIYGQKEHLTEAINLYLQSLSIFRELDDQVGVFNSLNNLGRIYIQSEISNKAITTLNEALGLAETNGWNDRKKIVFYNLAEAYEKGRKIEESLYYFKKGKSLDSLFFYRTMQSQLAEMQASYESEKKDQEIEFQKDKNRAKTKIQIITSSLSFVIILLLGQRYVVSQKISKKNKKLHDQEINQLIANQELKMIQAMIDGEENERNRIAEDLHDRLGSTLSATSMHLSVLEESGPDVSKQTQKVRDLLDKAIEDARQISHNLLSGVLTKFGFMAALIDLKTTIESANKVRMTIDTNQFDKALKPEEELQLYRIVQELVSNALKHSHADRLSLSLNRSENGYQILFTDDGIGFEVDNVEQGMGLKNIESRLAKIDASWELKSDDSGTRIQIDLAA